MPVGAALLLLALGLPSGIALLVVPKRGTGAARLVRGIVLLVLGLAGVLYLAAALLLVFAL